MTSTFKDPNSRQETFCSSTIKAALQILCLCFVLKYLLKGIVNKSTCWKDLWTKVLAERNCEQKYLLKGIVSKVLAETDCEQSTCWKGLWTKYLLKGIVNKVLAEMDCEQSTCWKELWTKVLAIIAPNNRDPLKCGLQTPEQIFISSLSRLQGRKFGS